MGVACIQLYAMAGVIDALVLTLLLVGGVILFVAIPCVVFRVWFIRHADDEVK